MSSTGAFAIEFTITAARLIEIVELAGGDFMAITGARKRIDGLDERVTFRVTVFPGNVEVSFHEINTEREEYRRHVDDQIKKCERMLGDIVETGRRSSPSGPPTGSTA